MYGVTVRAGASDLLLVVEAHISPNSGFLLWRFHFFDDWLKNTRSAPASHRSETRVRVV